MSEHDMNYIKRAREHAHESADREAFDNFSDEAKAEVDQKLGELMERFDETINEIRSDVAATHSDELDKLIAQYGVGAVRHYLEQTKSHCVNVSLRDLSFEMGRVLRFVFCPATILCCAGRVKTFSFTRR